MRWHMFLASKKLAHFTLTYNGVGIRHDGEPNEPLPMCLAHAWLRTCVTPADSYMNVLQDVLSFFGGSAFH
jgi:hypothetical protein